MTQNDKQDRITEVLGGTAEGRRLVVMQAPEGWTESPCFMAPLGCRLFFNRESRFPTDGSPSKRRSVLVCHDLEAFNASRKRQNYRLQDTL